jgi:hypothetical protein
MLCEQQGPPAPVLDPTLPHLLIGVESKREFRRVEHN